MVDAAVVPTSTHVGALAAASVGAPTITRRRHQHGRHRTPVGPRNRQLDPLPPGTGRRVVRARQERTYRRSAEAVARIEALGYGSLWWGEGIGGKDAFVNAAVVLSSSTTLIAGTGIANLWARHPANMQGAAATVGAAWPGRFVLGVGVSHGSQVDPSGQVYEKPLQRMASYLAEMDAASAIAPATSVPVPRVLAALRPRMLELASDRADGAHPVFRSRRTRPPRSQGARTRQAAHPRAGGRF